jgi:hypothetical protein
MPVHPLEERKLPPSKGTKFGVMRASGINSSHPECNSHCGVDLYYWKRDDPNYPAGANNPARNIGIGRAVFAVAAGKVIASSESSGAGKYIWLQHPGSWRSHYVHLDERYVKNGQQVAEGQQIGTLGRTGIKRDPAHLHFALSRYDSSKKRYVYFDPEPKLRVWPLVAGGVGGGVLLAAAAFYWFWRR